MDIFLFFYLFSLHSVFCKSVKCISSFAKKNLSLYIFFLLHRDDFNIQVLHAFVELHEFTDLNLVQALR